MCIRDRTWPYLPHLPRAVDVVLSDRFVGRWRRLATRATHGTVVEFGFGSGLNLPHLSLIHI